MFDVGFSELLVIAVVALLVLGPERLPKAARFAGLWMRRARAQWHSVKAEFEHEIASEELKRTLQETQASLRAAQASLREAGSDLQGELRGAADGLMRGPPLSPSTGSAASPLAATPADRAHDPEHDLARPHPSAAVPPSSADDPPER